MLLWVRGSSVTYLAILHDSLMMSYLVKLYLCVIFKSLELWPLTDWHQHSQEVTDPRCFSKNLCWWKRPVGKKRGKRERERERETERERQRERRRRTSKQMVQTVLWATGRRSVLIFEGCKTFVCPQCLKRNAIPPLTTKAAFDKTVGEIWRVLDIFPLFCFLVNCCPCTVLKFHPLYLFFQDVVPSQSLEKEAFLFFIKRVSSLCRG